MFTFLFSVYVVAHAVLLIWAIRLWRRDGAPGAPIIAMIAAGLVYDNFIIAIGATIGAGELSISLSWPRFALHAICTPFTMIAIWQFADAADFRWARMLIFIKRSAVAGCSKHSAINNQAILVSFFQFVAGRASLVSCHWHTQ